MTIAATSRTARFVAKSTQAIQRGDRGRVFFTINAPSRATACMPARGAVIVGVRLRSISHGLCEGGSCVRPGKQDFILMRADGETWSDVIARVGVLEAGSFLTLWVEHRSSVAGTVEVSVELMAEDSSLESRRIAESGDVTLARRRSAVEVRRVSLATVAVRYLPAGVALTFDADGNRIIGATKAGERLDPAPIQRSIVRAARADARRRGDLDAPLLRRALKSERRSHRARPKLASSRRRRPAHRRTKTCSSAVRGRAGPAEPPPRRRKSGQRGGA